MEQIPSKKKMSKLAIASLFFIIIGYLAISVCREARSVLLMEGYDPTKFQTYLVSIIPWFIALLLSLLALILIKYKSANRKSNFLPFFCFIVSMTSIIIFAIPIPQAENSVVVDRHKTFDGDSSELENTIIIPTLDSSIHNKNNIIWCSSFQIAWDELKDNVIEEPILLSSNQDVANLLNDAKPSKQDVTDNEYYARSGFVQNNIIENIQREMKIKFPGEPVPSFNDITSNTSIISYSFLSANVRFKMPYFENDKELIFTDSNGNKTSITSFGLREKDDYAFFKLRRQMYILFSKYNSKHELTECAIDYVKVLHPTRLYLQWWNQNRHYWEHYLILTNNIRKHRRINTSMNSVQMMYY